MKTAQPRWVSIIRVTCTRIEAGVKLRAVVLRDFLLIFQIDPRFSGIPAGARRPSVFDRPGRFISAAFNVIYGLYVMANRFPWNFLAGINKFYTRGTDDASELQQTNSCKRVSSSFLPVR